MSSGACCHLTDGSVVWLMEGPSISFMPCLVYKYAQQISGRCWNISLIQNVSCAFPSFFCPRHILRQPNDSPFLIMLEQYIHEAFHGSHTEKCVQKGASKRLDDWPFFCSPSFLNNLSICWLSTNCLANSLFWITTAFLFPSVFGFVFVVVACFCLGSVSLFLTDCYAPHATIILLNSHFEHTDDLLTESNTLPSHPATHLCFQHPTLCLYLLMSITSLPCHCPC